MHKRAAASSEALLRSALGRMSGLISKQEENPREELTRLLAMAWGGYDSRIRSQQQQMLRALELPTALAEDRLRLFRQPIVPVNPKDDHLCRFEILLRMIDESGEPVSVGPAIVACEQFGLMGAIDRWVIDTALANFDALTGTQPACEVSINLSANSLNDPSLPGFVLDRLGVHGVDATALCFEVTETAAITRMKCAYRTIRRLRQKGCRFALDDVGSGYASFSYLKAIPVDYLKIDGSFVQHITENDVDHEMVGALNRVGHSMGLRTIAEWVESSSAFSLLRELEVDFAQGYSVGHPESLEA